MTGQASTFTKTSFRSEKTSDIALDDPDFWSKVLSDCSSSSLLARLNDGSAVADEASMAEYMMDLKAGADTIVAESDPEPILQALVQLQNMRAFDPEAREIATKLYAIAEERLEAVGYVGSVGGTSGIVGEAFDSGTEGTGDDDERINALAENGEDRLTTPASSSSRRNRKGDRSLGNSADRMAGGNRKRGHTSRRGRKAPRASPSPLSSEDELLATGYEDDYTGSTTGDAAPTGASRRSAVDRNGRARGVGRKRSRMAAGEGGTKDESGDDLHSAKSDDSEAFELTSTGRQMEKVASSKKRGVINKKRAGSTKVPKLSANAKDSIHSGVKKRTSKKKQHISATGSSGSRSPKRGSISSAAGGREGVRNIATTGSGQPQEASSYNTTSSTRIKTGGDLSGGSYTPTATSPKSGRGGAQSPAAGHSTSADNSMPMGAASSSACMSSGSIVSGQQLHMSGPTTPDNGEQPVGSTSQGQHDVGSDGDTSPLPNASMASLSPNGVNSPGSPERGYQQQVGGSTAGGAVHGGVGGKGGSRSGSSTGQTAAQAAAVAALDRRPAPKRRGRPPGSRDKHPRKSKTDSGSKRNAAAHESARKGEPQLGSKRQGASVSRHGAARSQLDHGPTGVSSYDMAASMRHAAMDTYHLGVDHQALYDPRNMGAGGVMGQMPVSAFDEATRRRLAMEGVARGPHGLVMPGTGRLGSAALMMSPEEHHIHHQLHYGGPPMQAPPQAGSEFSLMQFLQTGGDDDEMAAAAASPDMHRRGSMGDSVNAVRPMGLVPGHNGPPTMAYAMPMHHGHSHAAGSPHSQAVAGHLHQQAMNQHAAATSVMARQAGIPVGVMPGSPTAAMMGYAPGPLDPTGAPMQAQHQVYGGPVPHGQAPVYYAQKPPGPHFEGSQSGDQQVPCDSGYGMEE
eukprot:Lankesteria_metandrocarpae@DN4277_c0_g1_i1.p1